MIFCRLKYIWDGLPHLHSVGLRDFFLFFMSSCSKYMIDKQIYLFSCLFVCVRRSSSRARWWSDWEMLWFPTTRTSASTSPPNCPTPTTPQRYPPRSPSSTSPCRPGKPMLGYSYKIRLRLSADCRLGCPTCFFVLSCFFELCAIQISN